MQSQSKVARDSLDLNACINSNSMVRLCMGQLPCRWLPEEPACMPTEINVSMLPFSNLPGWTAQQGSGAA